MTLLTVDVGARLVQIDKLGQSSVRVSHQKVQNTYGSITINSLRLAALLNKLAYNFNIQWTLFPTHVSDQKRLLFLDCELMGFVFEKQFDHFSGDERVF